MRVAYFITAFGMGGAEMQVSILSREMRKRGHDIMVCTLSAHPNSLLHRLDENGIETECLYMRNAGDFIPALRSARKLVCTWQPDLVHSHMVHANIFCRVLRCLAPVPGLICTAHSINEGGRARMIAYRVTNRLANLTTHVTEEAAAKYLAVRACTEQRSCVLQNCVDTKEFTKDPESGLQARCELGLGDKFTFIHVGRLEYPKDVSTVLNAFVDVVRRAPAYLLVVGDGPDRKHLEQQAGALDLNGSVKFLGSRNDVASLMNAAHCLVLSSAWEGLPLTILEAMACGLPVITTRYQGADELVGCAGLVVPGRNPEALAASMVCVQNKIAGYGSVGRRLVEDKYSVDHVCRKWESIYHSIALQQVLVPTLRHPGGHNDLGPY